MTDTRIMVDAGTQRERLSLVVVGNGMVSHHFINAAVNQGLLDQFDLTVISEEAELAYDRVNLSKFFEGKGAEDLALADPSDYDRLGVKVLAGDRVVEIDRQTQKVCTSGGLSLHYDKLVLATGSRPFVPPIEGSDAQGCFVYRTLEDLRNIRSAAENGKVGVVIGGGLLGLEAAKALQSLGLTTHVVEFAPRLMPLQVDEAGGTLLRACIEELGVRVHVSMHTQRVSRDEQGRVQALCFADGSELPVDMVVFSAGIRPRDELARQAGLAVAPRGGIAIDRSTRTNDPNILAVGECAAFEERCYGLVAPGYRMAETAAQVLAGIESEFADFDMSTKLKLLGVDVASFGDAFGQTAHSKEISLLDTVAGCYKKLVLSADKTRLLGGMLVGDASRYSELLTYVQNDLPLPKHPDSLIVEAREGGGGGLGIDALPDSATICSCHNLDKSAICGSIRDQQLRVVADIKTCTKAGTGCGSCVPLLGQLLNSELKRAGIAVNNYLCEHFEFSRQELFHLVRVGGIRTFDELLEKHGSGKGCEICKPAIASIFASTWNDYILEKSHAGLQDTNDRYLANIQRDGTYSVVPRIAGGEVTPQQLMALGRVAEKYGLYTKITGGQRIDMFGARLDQLPSIWRELVDAGFESGHAYGKALRTVKSCVGSTWCRYGVGDSVGLAIEVENRYKGLRSPHKLKGAVSGCARECAEAQGKDFGIIATDKGFNLYVCGNGGMKPQHAQLLAADIDSETVIKYLDRFLMFYIRTADRLQRTASWLNNLEGGLDYLKQVVIDDSLGICTELEADMARVIDTYQCEWKTTIEDPEKVKQFRPFINSSQIDPSVVFVPERNQHRPAEWHEKSERLARQVHLPLLQE